MLNVCASMAHASRESPAAISAMKATKESCAISDPEATTERVPKRKSRTRQKLTKSSSEKVREQSKLMTMNLNRSKGTPSIPR